VLDGQGIIYLSANNGTVAVSEDGKKLWNFEPAGRINVSPVVAADRTVLIAPWQDLIALGPDGTQLWRLTLKYPVNSSPVIGDNGVIYVADNRFFNALVATNGSSPLAKSSWPMFRANPRHTGRVNTN
jgi:hypothetical protein